MKLELFLEKCWEKYRSITPDAERIHALISKRGETVVNDHIAFRTFNIPCISRLDVGGIFEKWGYERRDDMDFTEKKLKATYWLHPDRNLPKVFVSELILEKMSPALQKWIANLVKPALGKTLSAEMLLMKNGQNWSAPRFEDYKNFYTESEYAAWTSAFGIQSNHFTVLVNSLKTFSSLEALNEFLISQGFVLNGAGGFIKGSPDEKLEQSSTQAKRVAYEFSDGTAEIMSCYYEFAKRYPVSPGGELFHGFIPKSADKIFESTFEKSSSKPIS